MIQLCAMIFPSILRIEVSARVDKQILFVHTVLRGIGAFDQMKMEIYYFVSFCGWNCYSSIIILLIVRFRSLKILYLIDEIINPFVPIIP